MTITIALLSPGAMGSAVGARLVENSARVLTSLEGRGPASKARAEHAGMEEAAIDQIVAADIILSILPPGDALALAERLAPALAATQHRPVYIDCNALSPATKQAVGEVIGATGARFIDGSIIGGPPKPGTPGPAFYVSGEHAPAAEPLAKLGIDLHLLDGPVGAAAALKMAYAGINKGSIGLGTAMILAASRAGAAGALRDQLAAGWPDQLAYFGRAVPDMYPKAYRWVAEMREIAAFAGDEATAMIFEGLARLYERIAADAAGGHGEIAALDTFLGRPAP